jgi:Single-strand binding protein family
MTTMSTVTVAGNLTRGPEIRYTRDGQAHSSLSLAVTRRWQNRDTQEWEEATAFFDVSCWRELALERRPQPHEGRESRGHRSPGAAPLGDRRRRPPDQCRDPGRRHRRQPPVRHDRGPEGRAPQRCPRARRRGGTRLTGPPEVSDAMSCACVVCAPTKAPSIEEGAFITPTHRLRQSWTDKDTQLHSAESPPPSGRKSTSSGSRSSWSDGTVCRR